MPQVYVCPACREEVTEEQKYVVTAKDQGVETRVHADCEKRRRGGPAFRIAQVRRR